MVLSHDLAPARQPLHLASGFPPAMYTSTDVYELERELVFARSWIAVARHDQLAEPGAFVTAEIAGEPVVVVRGRDGALRAFPNVCRHRGTPVELATRGHRDRFTCPTTAGPTTSTAGWPGCRTAGAFRRWKRRRTRCARCR